MAAPYFSLIIPYHNSSHTIGPLLDSIARSRRVPPLEVVVVDDGSAVPFAGWKPKGGRKLPFRLLVVRFDRNRGPAVARNRGAGKAKGKFLVFLDGDVRLFPDALANLWDIYRNDPDIVAVTGVWAKEQKSRAFFPNFKALRDWSYWINERDANGYYYLFSTRIASIKRAVFKRLGGFDERYCGPLVEDIELTYRIARRYAIIFAPTVRVHHEFEDFWPIAKKYFWRTFYWTRLYRNRRKFDPVATTWWEAISAVSGVAVTGLLVLVIGWIVMTAFIPVFQPVLRYLLLMTGTLMVVHAGLVRKFLLFTLKEKGWIFAIRSFATGIILYCFIVAGACWARLSR